MPPTPAAAAGVALHGMPAAAAAAVVSSPTEATPLSSSSNSSTSSSSRRHHHDRPAPLSPTYHRWRRRLRAVLLLALIGLIVWASVDSTVGPHVIEHGLSRFLAWVGRHPYAGAAAFLLVYAGCTLVFIPSALLTLGGSFLFGRALGPGLGFAFAFVAVFAGACLGAVAAFLLGRFLLHADAQRLLQRYPAMLAIDRALHPHTGNGSTPLKIMLLLRLSPLVPFAPLNYLMSLTSLGLRDYTLALAGMIPATLAYVFLGDSAGGLAAAAASSSSSPAAAAGRGEEERRVRIVLYALGAASLIMTVGLLSSRARRELRRLAPVEAAEAGDGEGEEEEGEAQQQVEEEEEEGDEDEERGSGGRGRKATLEA